MSEANFEKALQFLFPAEGGYVNNKNDIGGATNMGVTQSTYNFYLKNQGLASKDVKYITKEEAINIYYKYYWKESGADNIQDPNMAVALFDTAVLHGPNQAKLFYNKSGGNIDKFLDIRQKHYDKIVAENPSQKIFYQGWNNRVNNLRKNINDGTFGLNVNKTESIYPQVSNNNIDFSNNYLKPFNLGISYDYYPEKRILDLNNLMVDPIKFQNKKSSSDNEHNNFVDDALRIYTREDIGNMTGDEFAQNEEAIMSQSRTIGIPTNGDMELEVMTSGNVIYVHEYTRSDGTRVRGYYRSKGK